MTPSVGDRRGLAAEDRTLGSLNARFLDKKIQPIADETMNRGARVGYLQGLGLIQTPPGLPGSGLILAISAPTPYLEGAPSGVCRHRSGRSFPTWRRSENNHGHALRSVHCRRAGRRRPAACLRSAGLEANGVTAPAPVDTASPDERLARENTYLKQRNAQLQEDVTALSAEVERLRQVVERLHGRNVTPSHTPNPLGSGQ